MNPGSVGGHQCRHRRAEHAFRSFLDFVKINVIRICKPLKRHTSQDRLNQSGNSLNLGTDGGHGLEVTDHLVRDERPREGVCFCDRGP